MKVPLTSTQSNQYSSHKLHSTGRTNTTTGLCYEPKSVLDLSRSPSPRPVVGAATDKPVQKSQNLGFRDALLQSDEGSVHWDDHILNNFEDWDSLMRELELNDNSAPALKSISHFSQSDPQFQVHPELVPLSHSLDSIHTHFVPSDFNLSDVSSNQILGHNSNNSFEFCDFNHMNQWSNVGFIFVDELIRAADCFESNELQLAQVILARLNQQLQSPAGKPLQRAAFYVKEALQSLLTGNTTLSSGSSEIVQAIKAYKNFSNVSPIVMFSNFTANQAILEAVEGSMFIHIIDFEIGFGFGGQWASFMKEVADRAESRKSNTPVLRITAVVPEEYAVESRLIRDSLNQFAHELKIRFEIHFISIRTFEFLSFKAIKFMEAERTAVLLSPTVFHRMGVGARFLEDLRQISPHVVVLVDAEGMADGGTPSFRRSVIDGLEYYSTVLESLEAASVGGGGDDWIRRIEMFLLRPKIFAAVEAAGRRALPWREAFAAAGLRPVGLSQFADFQAECLLRKVQVRGFQVAKRQAELVLCWQERALVATSAWRC